MGARPRDPRRTPPPDAVGETCVLPGRASGTLIHRAQQPDTYYEKRLEVAEDVHRRHCEIQDQLHARMADFAGSAMRGPGVVATAAIGAILVFLGGNVGQMNEVPATLAPYVTPLLLFGGSLLAGTLAPGAVYLGLACFAAAMDRERFTWLPPYVEETRTSRWLNRVGIGFRIVTVALVAVAAIGIFLGGLTAWRVAVAQ